MSIVPILAALHLDQGTLTFLPLKVKNGSSGRCFHVLNGRNTNGFKWNFLSISVFLPISISDASLRRSAAPSALLKSFKVYPEQSQSSGATQSWVQTPPPASLASTDLWDVLARLLAVFDRKLDLPKKNRGWITKKHGD